MAVKLNNYSGTNWVDGTILTADDLVDTTEVVGPLITQIYTGSGYDTEQIGNGTTTGSYLANFISADKLSNKTYLKVEFLSSCLSAETAGIGLGVPYVKFQTAQSGTSLSFADAMSYKNVGLSDNVNSNEYVSWYHELSSNEKALGCYVLLYSQCVNASDTGTTSYTNNQTVITAI